MNNIQKYIFKYIKSIIVLFIMIAIQAGIIFVGPMIIRTLLDQAEFKNTSNLLTLISIYFGVLIFSYVISIIYEYATVKMAIHFKTVESKRIYKDLFGIDYSYIRELEPTYFVTRIKQAVDNIYGLIGDKTPKAIVSIVTLIICLFFLASINNYIMILFILLIPTNLISYHRLNNYLKNASKRLQHVCANNFKDIINVIRNIEFIKLSTNYDFFVRQIGKYIENIEAENGKLQIKSSIYSSIIDLLINIIKSGVLILSIYFYIKDNLSFSNVMFVNLLLNIYYSALLDLKRVNLSLRDLRISQEFIEDSINNKKEKDEGVLVLDTIENIYVHVKDFKYPGENNMVINDLMIHVNPYEKLSLVGKSGCGKSTITKLLTRLYEAEEIKINGIPIDQYDIKSLRKSIYLVTQNVYLFPGTIKDNIVIGQEVYKSERLNEILNLSFLEDFRLMPQGFDTIIKEDGSNISGGQKQKIAIARMLVSDAQVIILDEATSALDSNSESLIYHEIERYIEKKIVIKISHRISTISHADRIYVIKEGKVDSYGNNDELLERSEEFKRLFNKQIS